MHAHLLAHDTERSFSETRLSASREYASSKKSLPAAMMAPATDLIWIDVVHTMRNQKRRIDIGCLILAFTMFSMTAGRVASAYLGGTL